LSAALTLVEFLEQTGATVHAFDIGHRVGVLPREALLDFEQAVLAYPRPLQRKAWIALVHHDNATPEAPLLAALVRGLSADATDPAVRAALEKVLEHPAGGHIEMLAAIGGRAWEALGERGQLNAYLARLAGSHQGQAAFEQCLRDLLSVPGVAEGGRQAQKKPRLGAAAGSH
jgi:hypothetical protein